MKAYDMNSINVSRLQNLTNNEFMDVVFIIDSEYKRRYGKNIMGLKK